MAGKGKGFVEYDWLIAYQTCKLGLVELDEPVRTINKGSAEPIEIFRVDMMPSEEVSPEQNVIKKDCYLALSQEAKEIIGIVLNAPAEILEAFTTPKYDKVSKKLIKEFLINHGWPKGTVSRCFDEIKEFSSNFS